MMRGFVTDDCDARLPLRLRGPTGIEIEIESVIDTGFDGQLTLSPVLVRSLGLFPAMEGDAVFANDNTSKVVYYSAELY